MTVAGFKKYFDKDKFLIITFTSGNIYRANVKVDTMEIDETDELLIYEDSLGKKYITDIGDIAAITLKP